MTPAILNISLYSSSDFEIRFKFRRKIDKSTIDLTGTTGVAEVRKHTTDITPLVVMEVSQEDDYTVVRCPKTEIVRVLAGADKVLAGWDLNIVINGKSTMYIKGSANFFMSNSRVQ